LLRAAQAAPIGNIVTSVYAAIIRECAAKGGKARFRRAEVKEMRDGKAVALRGYFTLADEHAGKK
jgi:hypothetical protein